MDKTLHVMIATINLYSTTTFYPVIKTLSRNLFFLQEFQQSKRVQKVKPQVTFSLVSNCEDAVCATQTIFYSFNLLPQFNYIKKNCLKHLNMITVRLKCCCIRLKTVVVVNVYQFICLFFFHSCFLPFCRENKNSSVLKIKMW